MSKLKPVSKKDEDLHELVEITEGLSPCNICLLPANPENVKVGPLYKLGDCQAHIRCLWFSSALEQKGEDEEGIKGFLYEDIVKECRRGSRLKCFYCANKNATTGCCVKKCKKSYHYPCGQKDGAMFQFYGEFNSFCETHRPVQAPSMHKSQEVEEEDQCGVCLDEMEKRVSPATLWTPCCGGWFHRLCIEKMAECSGLSFFKCPLCNNKETFEKEMLDQGVYIPNQDAEWENDNAYEDLYQRHNSCDVEVCVCPEGRLMDDVNNDDSPWEIFLCRTCGHQGSHITCGDLDFEFPMFECQPCLDIARKQNSPPRPVFHPSAGEDDIQIAEESNAGQSSSSQKFKIKLKNKNTKLLPRGISVTRGSQELSGKERRTRIYELLYFIPSAVLKQLTPKKLENLLVAHRCDICEKVFRLPEGVKPHKEDAHETLLDLSVNMELENRENVADKRRESLREKPVLNYNDNFYCDYECGFSTKVLTNHIKRHHTATTTTKIKHIQKHCDENGNTHLPRQQRSSDLDFTDEPIREPKVIKSQVSCIQEADNKAEAIIVISDDEEEVATPKTTETDGNCRELMSFQQFPNVNTINLNQSDTTVIVSDDDESMTPWKPGTAKKKTVTKRLFSDSPLRQYQIRNGGLNPQDKSKREVKELLKMIRRLGPSITITKTTSDNSNTEKTKEAINKIRKLGPAISFSRANK